MQSMIFQKASTKHSLFRRIWEVFNFHLFQSSDLQVFSPHCVVSHLIWKIFSCFFKTACQRNAYQADCKWVHTVGGMLLRYERYPFSNPTLGKKSKSVSKLLNYSLKCSARRQGQWISNVLMSLTHLRNIYPRVLHLKHNNFLLLDAFSLITKSVRSNDQNSHGLLSSLCFSHGWIMTSSGTLLFELWKYKIHDT